MAFKTLEVLLLANAGPLKAGLLAASRDVELFGASASAAGASSASAAGSVNALGGTMGGTTLAVVAGAAAMGASVKAAMDLEAAMRNVNSISKLSEGQLNDMTSAVVDLSRELPQSATELAKGLYDIASSGFQGADGMTVLAQSAKAATAGLTTTDNAARAITAVLNAYGLSASEATDVSDALFQTVNLGVINFEELSSVIGDTVGVAAAAHIDIGQVGAALATMTLSGVSASEAGTSLNRVIQSIIDPSKEMAAALHSAGYESGAQALEADGLRGVMEKLRVITGGNVTEVQKLFPEMRALRGAFGLMSDEGKKYADVAGQIEDTNARSGATSNALKEQMKALSNQLKLLKNDVVSAAIEIGQVMLPVLESLTSLALGAFSALDKLASAAGGIGAVAKKAAWLLPGLGPLMSAAALKDQLTGSESDIPSATVGSSKPIHEAASGINLVAAAAETARAKTHLLLETTIDYRQRAHELAQNQRSLADAHLSVSDAQARLSKLQAKGAVDAEQVASATERVTQADQGVLDATDKVAESQSKLNDLLSKGAVDADKVAQAQERLADSTHSVAAAQDRVVEAQERLNKLLAGPDAEDVSKAQHDVREAELALSESQRRVSEADQKRQSGGSVQSSGSDRYFQRFTAKESADAEAEYQRALLGAESASFRLTDAQKALNATQDIGKEGTKAVTEARKGLSDAEYALTKELKAHTQAEQDLSAALAGDPEFNDKVAAARKTVEGAERDLERAIRDRQKAHDDLSTALAGDPDFNDKVAEAIRGVARAVDAVKEAEFQLEQQRLSQQANISYGEAQAGEAANRSRVPRFAWGGLVPGHGVGDTVPALLSPGEFVLRASAVDYFGASTMHAMNRYAEGGLVSPVGPMSWSQTRGVGSSASTSIDYRQLAQAMRSEFGDHRNVNMTVVDSRPLLIARELAWELA